tara:strand:- start:76 stop:204 length:129 start_codon:yes stop_codon:yes gene_type:complete
MTGSPDDLIKEIEAFLALAARRELFTADEVQNLLLDLRALVA